MRKTWATWFFFAGFAGCITFAYAWFNTTTGAGRSTLDAGRPPGIWLQARTNIEGYTFVPEPVSDQVMKTLGTTNILSGTFYEIGDRRSAEPSFGLTSLS